MSRREEGECMTVCQKYGKLVWGSVAIEEAGDAIIKTQVY